LRPWRRARQVQGVTISVAVFALTEQLLGQGEDERGEQIVR